MQHSVEESDSGRWMTQTDDLKIGDIRVQPRLLQVIAGGRVHRLEPKTMQVLLRLASKPGQTVTREELFADVWPNVHVTEDVLNRSIYRLRKVVEDAPRSPRYIETIPRVGYRLLVPVEEAAHDAQVEIGRDNMERVASAGLRSEKGEPAGPTSGPPELGSWGWRAWATVVGLALAAALLGVLAISGVSSRAYPSGPADSEQLSYSNTDSVSRSDTSAIRVAPLFPGPGHQIQPALSPDGDRIAYSGPSENGSWDIFIGLVTEGTTIRRTESAGTDMAAVWSKDGAQLAWIRYSPEGCTIHRGPYLGSEEGRVADCPAATQPRLAWSPDGRTLVYSGGDDAKLTPRLWKLDLASGEAEPLTEPPRGLAGDYFPAYSRDGAWIAFARGTVLGATDIFVVSAMGGEVRRMTFDSLVVSGLDFSPDGRHVIFASNRSGDFGLWKIPLSGGDPEWLGYSAPLLEEVSVAVGNHRIAVVSSTGHTELWASPVASFGGEKETSDGRLLIPSTRDDWGGQYSPDGRTLAWVSSRSGSSEIWVAEAGGGSEPVRKSRFGGPYLGTPRWSPDGRTLLFEAQSVATADLYWLDLDGDRPRPITDGSFHELAPRWSADGRSILFASDRSGTWEVWRMGVEDRKSKKVTQDGASAGLESFDGRWLYYTKRERPGLWMVPTDGEGEVRRLVDDLQPTDWRTVVPVPGGVLYARRSAGLEVDLVRLDTENGKVETLRKAMELPHFSDLDLSPDGRMLLHSRWHKLDADLYLLENLL